MLFLILALGFVLRLFALTSHNFWFDEALTYHIAKLPVFDLLQAVLSDNNPPIYYLLIHYFLELSDNQIWLRLPSLLSNLASAYLMFRLILKFSKQNTATLAASLFLLSPLSIYMATEARLHSVATFLLLLSIITFASFLKKPNAKNALAFTAITTLGFYTQYYLLLLLFPFILLAVKSLPKNKLLVLILPLVAISPWLILSLQSSHNGCWCPNTLLSLPSALASPIVAGVGRVTLRTFPSLPLPIFTFFIATTLTSLFFFLKGLSKNYFFLAIYLLPLIALSAVGLLFPVFSPKAFSVFMPIYFLFVTQGIIKSKFLQIMMIFALALISALQVNLKFFKAEDLKKIHDITMSKANIPVYHTSILTYYPTSYFDRNLQINHLVTVNPLNAEFVAQIGGQKQPVDVSLESFWLIDTEIWAPSDRQEAILQISKSYNIITKESADNISIILFAKK